MNIHRIYENCFKKGTEKNELTLVKFTGDHQELMDSCIFYFKNIF